MKKFRVGLIGCGGISGAHIPVLKAMENVEITAVADIHPERVQAAAEKTGARIMPSWQDLIVSTDVDVVHVLTPHYLHAPMAIAALKAGKHVLTEKPMASTLADAKALIEASEAENSPVLGVIFQNRYNPANIELMKIAHGGAYGKLLGMRASVNWHREAPYYTQSGWRGAWSTEGGGSLINQSIHTLDLMIQLGGPVARVKGTVSTDRLADAIEVEDNAHAVLDFASGARGLIYTTNNYTCDAPVMVECVFENATWQMIGDKLFRVEDGVPVLHLDGAIAATVADKAYWGAGHAAQIAHYYDCLARGEKFPIDGRSAYPALELVKGIYTSSDEKRWVEMQG